MHAACNQCPRIAPTPHAPPQKTLAEGKKSPPKTLATAPKYSFALNRHAPQLSFVLQFFHLALLVMCQGDKQGTES